MTPTRSGSNYSIQSKGTRQGHSSHKYKRLECQLRGEAQMEDSRISTNSQRLASSFEALIESPESDINAITVVRPEPVPTGNNRDRPVSVQELVYGSKTKGVGTSAKSLERHKELLSSSKEVQDPRQDRGPSEGLDTHFMKRTSPTDKAWLKSQTILSEDQKQKLAQGKDNSPVKAPQASKSKNTPQKVPRKGKPTPKSNQKGKQKEKEREKPK
ncbi:hypothetical protein O181_132168 [Austropuccinia psidii MF-1]|uniref:Uncharacterized protein n=1 Tax=Austropuccinia psidii MF-1 TaxID=1389203 RepID=A0A9Q3L1U2_9BASI|nr:hypothetical protein [Austropuccinia psidii MF-1]